MMADSRKRPLESEVDGLDGGASKRSNVGQAQGEMQLKVLIPSAVAGSVIGKKGECILKLQKETGARVRMSHNDDYYPGTNERVCLVLGPVNAILDVHDFIMDKIKEKPDKNSRPDVDTRSSMERHRQKNGHFSNLQTKLLVPNTTAGMIIGKRGSNVQQIKDQSGAFVQVSQKPMEGTLPERCVTVAGEGDNIRMAVDLILEKISEDPQSNSCPNISYKDIHHLVASANPTGSPFARGNMDKMEGGPPMGNPNMGRHPMGGGPGPHPNGSAAGIGVGMQQLNLSNTIASGLQGAILDSIRSTLSNAGFQEPAVHDIVGALSTLTNYNLLTVGLGSQGVSISIGGSLGGPQGGGPMGGGMGGGQQGPMRGGGPGMGGGGGQGMGVHNQPNTLIDNNFDSMNPAGMESNVFGPMGTTTTTRAPDTLTTHSGGNSFSSSGNVRGGSIPFGSGLGQIGNQSAVMAQGQGPDDKREIEVPEAVVGVILGRGGSDIVHLQQQTCTRVQISKKGVYSPGTQNRIVTITGPEGCVRNAECIIMNKVAQEEARRNALGTNGPGDGGH